MIDVYMLGVFACVTPTDSATIPLGVALYTVATPMLTMAAANGPTAQGFIDKPL